MRPQDRVAPLPLEMAVDRAIRSYDFLAKAGLLSEVQRRKVWGAIERFAQSGGAELLKRLEAVNRDDSARVMGTGPLAVLRRCALALVGR